MSEYKIQQHKKAIKRFKAIKPRPDKPFCQWTEDEVYKCNTTMNQADIDEAIAYQQSCIDALKNKLSLDEELEQIVQDLEIRNGWYGHPA